MASRSTWLLDLLLIAGLTALLIRPIWKLKFHDNWASIESTFIADARILTDHWPRPLWNPFWYTGARFDYIYPPALRYGTAILAKYYPMSTAKAYHLYTGFFYCFGIAAVYFLARVGFRRRWAGWAAAFGAAVVSPAYLFLPAIARDGFEWGNARLNALVRFGEGPHMTALAWLPLAIACAWLALSRRSFRWTLLGGLASAGVVANNFYGATALAMFFPLLCWAWWVTHRDWRLFRFVLPIPFIAYGLCASWFTPSYVKLTLRNMQYVSSPGNLWSGSIALVVLLAFLAFTDRRYRLQTHRTWELFLAGSFLFFSLNTLGNYWFNFRLIGEPMRLVPELDLIYIFALIGLAVWLWPRGRLAQTTVLLGALTIVGIHHDYLWRHRSIFPKRMAPEDTVYYRIPAWIAANHPHSRSYVTGAVRFWFNTWHDLAQLGGSSEQGLENPMVMPSQWEILLGEDPRGAIAWLKAMGVDLVAVHGPNSEEVYKDFQYPRKFDNVLPVVFDDGKDNRIFEIPRRWRSLGRVVDAAALSAAPKIANQTDFPAIEAYVNLLEKGPDVATATQWHGTEELEIRLARPTAPGEALVAQVTFDKYWKAESNLGDLPIERIDALWFQRIATPPGVHWVRLKFTKPLEKTLGEIIFFLTLAGIGYTLWRWRVPKNSLPPA
jgi:hypothetical protein